ncbi:MAG: adenine methylase Dam [Mucilaginibacter sp.]|nr:adenine methylase Dam [Mucilaginibacter sp.]
MTNNINLIPSKKIIQAKPFLRWAGGKTWLIKHLNNVKTFKFNNYHEPFLGGGATFFYINPSETSYLSDLNEQLIDTYIAIRDNVNLVINKLKTFENSEKQYYIIRDTEFLEIHERAAKFIFLNQTSFNGIYRVNLKGVYNVPYGYRNKNFLDEELLRLSSTSLRKTELVASDFDIVRNNIREGDLVFLDPPYTVSHNDNGFIKYNEKLFSLDDQYRLSNLISYIKEQNAYYILTNAAHNKVKEIFEKNDSLHELPRASLIGGTNAVRGSFNEFVFTNLAI